MHAMQDEGGAPLSDGAGRGGRHTLVWTTFAVAIFTLLADQGTKVWALAALDPGRPVSVIGDVLRLNLIRNPGAAFSIGNQATWVLTILAAGVIVVIVASMRRIGHVGWAVCLGLLLGGAVGNLIDRFFREPGFGRGHVVDMIDYGGLFIGNVADIAIVAAAVVIAVLAWLGIGLDGRRETDRTPASE